MDFRTIKKLSDDEIRVLSRLDNLEDRIYQHFELFVEGFQGCDWVEVGAEAKRIIYISEGEVETDEDELITAMVARGAAVAGWESALNTVAEVIGCDRFRLRDAIEAYQDGEDLPVPVADLKAWVLMAAPEDLEIPRSAILGTEKEENPQ